MKDELQRKKTKIIRVLTKEYKGQKYYVERRRIKV